MDEQVLLSTIIAAPDDDRPRLAYADWLDERGRRDRARLIRVQIELARLPRSEGEPTALEVEEEQLEAVCAESMPRLDGIEWGGFYRGLVESVFPDTPASFRRHAGSIAFRPQYIHPLAWHHFAGQYGWRAWHEFQRHRRRRDRTEEQPHLHWRRHPPEPLEPAA